ncbi:MULTISPECIES: deaminase [Flavobacterium]|uniref:Deaminase n=1 Tax=Flavobacterium jumunjinense TaxID=998845 RepID=A0ABV5GJL6_9FLAO|nr:MULTISPECIES: deaminase [Flavobacterium]
MNFLKKLFWPVFYIFLGTFFTILIYLIVTNLYLFSTNKNITNYEKRLSSLAEKCIPSNDVPVASLLIYNDSIIGEGYNDVSKNNNPSGHAEINAVKNCFDKIGYKKFKALDRNKLYLITTYEPCKMCRGLIEEYDISNVIFGLSKKSRDKLISIKKDFNYYRNLKQTTNPRLQYDLFKRYESFDSIKHPY